MRIQYLRLGLSYHNFCRGKPYGFYSFYLDNSNEGASKIPNKDIYTYAQSVLWNLLSLFATIQIQ